VRIYDALLGGKDNYAADLRPVAARDAAAVYDHATSPVTLRTRAQVAGFFGGWDPIEPGLVQVPLWRPDGSAHCARRWRTTALRPSSARSSARPKPASMSQSHTVRPAVPKTVCRAGM
jgi:hypothetical protein